ncbi:MAG: hypothetical protein A2341_23045 [Deltaproteobacteria bacterium RIFOXYB12_FULL_58_9]|nr:MAG: hypothetical protein A2341_23045 [Deltaproteobacteria bacterium RIFOXYB12_FULL_58_9]
MMRSVDFTNVSVNLDLFKSAIAELPKGEKAGAPFATTLQKVSDGKSYQQLTGRVDERALITAASGMSALGTTQSISAEFEEQLQVNGAVLQAELDWMLGLVQQRVNGDRKPIANPPDLSGVSSPYAALVRNAGLDTFDRLALILSLAPHIKPSLMNVLGGDCFSLGSMKLLVGGGNVTANLGIDKWRDCSALLDPANRIMELVGDPDPWLKITDDYRAMVTIGKLPSDNRRANMPAIKIDTGMTWDDLVVSYQTEQELREVIVAVKNQDLLDKRMAAYAQSKGTSVLMQGTNGTGKRVAAEVVAKELGLDPYLVKSEEILGGGIERAIERLEHLFTRARQQNAALIFDPGESFIGTVDTRGSAGDKIEMALRDCLARLIASHPGLVIVINRAGGGYDGRAFNFDKVVHFPYPSGDERQKIWTQFLENKNVDEQARTKIPLLGRMIELTQSEIVFAIHYAEVAAKGAPIDIEMLFRGCNEAMRKHERGLSGDTLNRLRAG